MQAEIVYKRYVGRKKYVFTVLICIFTTYLKEKAEEIYKFFVGKEMLYNMQEDFGELGKLNLK